MNISLTTNPAGAGRMDAKLTAETTDGTDITDGGINNDEIMTKLRTSSRVAAALAFVTRHSDFACHAEAGEGGSFFEHPCHLRNPWFYSFLYWCLFVSIRG